MSARRIALSVPVPVGADSDVLASFREDPGAWLPDPARRRGPDRWESTLSTGPFARTVVCKVGPGWVRQGSVWRAISWQPVAEPGDPVPVHRLLPSFFGELGIERNNGTATLLLRGRYRRPGGIVGVISDELALQRAARATLERFLLTVAGNVADRVLAPSGSGGVS